MDKNGIFSSPLGLEISLNHHQQNPNFHHRQPPFTGAGTTSGAAVKQPYPYVHKQRASPISDEEIPATTTTTDDSGGAGDGMLRKGSPWQRMKWTDNMVRLLIMVVFYVGDEVGSDQVSDTAAKKKGGGGGGGGGGVMQKKGKWKSVSKAMMEKGFYVSPQQCEDKFNDLNKRYKRVNDILGKGIACKVVENNSLLETMDHIPLKLKEEVKKLLNSKHLFFREMCAYHNTCGGGVGGGGGGGSGVGVGVARLSPPLDATANEHPAHHTQKCVHSKDEADEEDDEEDGDDEEEDDGLSKRKRSRMGENDGRERVIRRFNGELSLVIQDLTKSVWEKRQWMKVKRMQLEEQRLGFEGDTYELEKRRLRWVKFCWSREREMELEKMRNERMKLENERMVILLRQKERELVDV